VWAAVASGAGCAALLPGVRAAGLAVPPERSGPAEDGVPTLVILRDTFPEAGRAALTADRVAAAESGDGGGVTGFLERHFEARSVQPRDGAGTDAVLSRAEAALAGGKLPQVLTELAALPDPARAPMSDWIALAQTRQDAIAAADALANRPNTN